MAGMFPPPAGENSEVSRWVRISAWVFAGALAMVLLGFSFHLRSSAEEQLSSEQQKTRDWAASHPAIRSLEAFTSLPVTRGARLADLLHRADVDTRTTNQIIEAARPLVDFRRLRQGQALVLGRSGEGEFRSLRYRVNRDEEILIRRNGEKFDAAKIVIPSTIETRTVEGKVASSLFEAVIGAGEHPELAVRLADTFAWDLDFYTDPRPGDTFRLVFEKKSYGGDESAAYGRIFVAEYNNAGRAYQAVLFHDSAGRPAYYSADGKSLQKAFLRSPLKFAARVSSHYSRHRFHPVLKMYRAHLGTDYAAPVGTPVQAVADGRVLEARRKGGDGNMVRLKHANGYETYYLHLSRMLVHTGQAIRQGQTIGRVGATGLATGPHLDFRVRRSSSFVNFEAMKLPPTTPVAKKDLAEFEAERDRWMPLLNQAGSNTVQASVPQQEQKPAGQPAAR